MKELSDTKWKWFENIFSEVASKCGEGMPLPPYGHVLICLLYIPITKAPFIYERGFCVY